VQVLNLGATGPVFYYFSKPPVYDRPIIWKEDHDNVAIEAFDNKVRLSYALYYCSIQASKHAQEEASITFFDY
jgi:hypothetical protein